MKEVMIVAAVRTPIGNYGGSLSNFSPAELGSLVIKEALKRATIKPNLVDEVIMGCVLQAGQGQGVARQASVKAGIPYEIPATTINIICGSGLRSVSLAAQTIISGDNDIVVAGGTEVMSKSGYILDKARFGYKMGNGKLIDTMVKDGLWDAFNDYHMGITAENIVEKYKISRKDQDEFAVNSQNKAEKAQLEGKFEAEILPIEIKSRRKTTIFSEDEYIKKGVTMESVGKLRAAFKKNGSVTAANSSGINDGAVAIILMSKEKVQELGVTPIASIVSYATCGVNPEVMGLGPIPATKKALKIASLKMEDIDLIEANEAFSAQSIAVAQELGFDMNKVNVNGGAIALGHPIGASGGRILVTLLHQMVKQNAKTGLATLCIGGGMGTSLIVKR